jgi:hypothetical protein
MPVKQRGVHGSTLRNAAAGKSKSKAGWNQASLRNVNKDE